MMLQNASVVAEHEAPEMATERSRFPLAAALVLTLSLVVSALFVRSSLAHLANPYFFLSSVYGYKLTGATVGFALALVLPFLQIVIACCLLGRIFVPAALGIAALLFAAYSAAQGSALWRGLNVACGCFGAADSSPVTLGTLAVAVTLFICCAAAFFVTRLDRASNAD